MGSIKNYIRKREEVKAGAGQWALTLTAVIMARNLLEGMFIDGTLGFSAKIDISIMRFFFHYPLVYLSTAAALIIVLHIFTREDIVRLARAVLSFFWIIVLGPLFDAIFLGGKHFPLGFFYSIRVAVKSIVCFFMPFISLETASPGVRLEIFIMTMLIAAYLWYKTGKVLRTVFGTLAGYFTILFVSATIPVVLLFILDMPYTLHHLSDNLLKQLTMPGTVFFVQDSVYALIYAVFLAILLLVAYALYDRRKFAALARNIRPLRVLHYMLLSFLGAGYACLSSDVSLTRVPGNIFALSGLLFGMFFLCQSAAVCNDIIDRGSDELSNRCRPLVQGAVKEDEYRIIGNIFFFIGICSIIAVSYYGFLVALLFWLLYYVYSCPPLRLKKIFILNMAIIALNGFLAFFAGISIVRGPGSFSVLNGEIFSLLTIPFFLGMNFITLKDVEGDGLNGVQTIPVIFGKEKGKKIIAGLSLGAFTVPGIILCMPGLLLPGFFWGSMAAWLVMRKKWNEKLFFLVYYLFFLTVIVLYWQKIR